jgi:hypothetical protein
MTTKHNGAFKMLCDPETLQLLEELEPEAQEPEPAFTSADLAMFTGCVQPFRNPMFGGFIYTEGIQFLGTHDAAWLQTDVLCVLKYGEMIPDDAPFVAIIAEKPNPKESSAVVVTYTDGNEEEYYRQEYEQSDLPVDRITMFCVPTCEDQRILMLASEY